MRTVLKGARAAAANARLLAWLLAGHLTLAGLAVAPLFGPLHESLARHESAGDLAVRFDMSWWVDLTTSRAETFGATLNSVALASLMSAAMGCFFAGGMLQAHHDALEGLPMDRFMTACRRWGPRFVLLLVMTLPLYWLVHRMINGHLAVAIDDWIEGVSDERAGLAIQLARSALFLLLFDVVTLVGDYARVHAIVRADRSMLSALSSGLRFVVLRPARVASLEATALGLQALVLVLFLPVSSLAWRVGATPAGLLAALVASQGFLLVRLFLREAARAAQVAAYRESLTDSR